MKNPITILWNYFVSMNSEKGGGVSIKRNIAWGIATLLVWLEVYSVMKLIEKDMDKVILLCKFYAVVNSAMILLALGITSLEKISDLVQKIKGGVINNVQTPAQTAEPKPEADLN